MILNLKNVIDNMESFNDEQIEKHKSLIIKSLDYYVISNENKRNDIRNEFEINDFLKILTISDFFIEDALNKKREEYLKYALILLSIENFRFDLRDNLIRLVAIWNVAERIDLKSEGLFKESISYFTVSSKNHIKDFIERPKALKTMKSMCLKYIENNGRISIKMIG